MPNTNRGWILEARPIGNDFESALKWRDIPLAEPEVGQLLVRTVFLSLDPAARSWMQENSYMSPISLGSPMRGGIVGRVERSNAPGFKPGDLVAGLASWSEYCVVQANAISRLPDMAGLPLTAAQGLFGVAGGTAYLGLMELGRPKPGETLVISGAAGSVGSLVGQIGKLQGCRVVGIAGSADKCAWLVDELGFDHAIDYRREDMRAKLAAVCPNKIDIYWENVGGAIANAAIANIARKGRVVLCGLISQHNGTDAVEGINLRPVLINGGAVYGFMLTDYLDKLGDAYAALVGWYREGRLKYRADVVDGLENAVTAFSRLFISGAPHMGKLMVRVDPEAR